MMNFDIGLLPNHSLNFLLPGLSSIFLSMCFWFIHLLAVFHWGVVVKTLDRGAVGCELHLQRCAQFSSGVDCQLLMIGALCHLSTL